MSLPRIAITMGDPAGVGPELCLRLLRDERVRAVCTPIVFGDVGLLARVARQLGWPLPDPAFLRDLQAIDAAAVEPGTVSAACGQAAYQYITTAIDEALAGRVDAIATGPIHKEALHAAGIPFPGHTEILAERTKSDRVCMMLTSDAITCALVTVHVGLREVPVLLSRERILDTIELTAAAMAAAARPQAATDRVRVEPPRGGKRAVRRPRGRANHRAGDRGCETEGNRRSRAASARHCVPAEVSRRNRCLRLHVSRSRIDSRSRRWPLRTR